MTSYMKTFQQMDWINFVAAADVPVLGDVLPAQRVPAGDPVRHPGLPLWHGVELVRALTTGAVDVGLLWHVLYYVVMIAVGLVFTTRRLRALFLD